MHYKCKEIEVTISLINLSITTTTTTTIPSSFFSVIKKKKFLRSYFKSENEIFFSAFYRLKPNDNNKYKVVKFFLILINLNSPPFYFI
jgi:hypothetical protein